MEDLDKDFVIYRSNTFRRKALDRSLSSRMLLESSVSAECALLSKYERLSQSMRSPNDPSPRQRKCGVWRILGQVLLAKRAIELPRKATNGASAGSLEVLTSSFMEGIVRKEASTAASKEGESKKKKKIKRSSWLPDPQRRWPVQGW